MNENALKELKLPFLAENMEPFICRCQNAPDEAIQWWLNAELAERTNKRLQTRRKASRIGHVKPMTEFDWDWPSTLDKATLKHVFSPAFFKQMQNVLIVGPEGLGKTMIAKNIALTAIEHGYRSLCVSASMMVGDLCAQKDGHPREIALKRYTSPHLLVIDEIGYVTYSQDSAFNLFEVISRRYEQTATVVTTNLAFRDWSQIFPDAHCVTSLVDRLFHHAIVLNIAGKSYRLHEHKQAQRKIQNER